jgi:hypothetical protein
MKAMAYISLYRFHMDSVATISKCLDDIKAAPALGRLFARRLMRVYH